MSCSEVQHTFNTYVSAEGPLPPSEVALRSLELGSIPAATMLFGSLATILAPKPPPKVVAHALQHLAAGIMMCAIAMELVPPMAKAKGQSSVFALVVGFSLGVAVMIGLSIFLDEVGDGGSDQGESEGELDVGLGDVAAAESEALLSGELRDSTADGQSEDSGGVAPRSKVGQAYSHVSDDHGAGVIGGGARVEVQRPMFPWLFAFCVYVDSCMDGLLVGLALVTGNSAGIFMAAAMAVEMGFLGLTFAAACTSQPLYLSLPAVVAGPFFLVCGSALGGVVANSLAANEPALVGCTAFSVAALLYMVCEELLVSAHEEDDHVWWVDIQVFVGFLLAMLMNKLIGHEA